MIFLLKLYTSVPLPLKYKFTNHTEAVEIIQHANACTELMNNAYNNMLEILRYTSHILLIGPTTSVLSCDGLSILIILYNRQHCCVRSLEVLPLGNQLTRCSYKCLGHQPSKF